MGGAEMAESSNEWEHIQSPFLQIPPATQSRSETPVIVDNYLSNGSSVFPPSHHEGLQIPPRNSQPLHLNPNSPSSSSSSSSSVFSPSPTPLQNSRRCRIFRLASLLREYGVCGAGFWSFMSLAGVVSAVFISLVYVRVNRWRSRGRLPQENKDPLLLLIRQKDEKINQLLLQIAQMTEVISARRRVPVVRIG